MDAEILFFMTAKDQSDFLTMVRGCCDSLTKQIDSNKFFFKVAGCHLIFTPTMFEDDTLYAGKLEIRTSSFPEETSQIDKDRVQAVFRKLRNWIKKNYWSRLAYFNQNKKGKLTPSRNHWLGPDAKRWKQENTEKHVLKLSKTSWMEFEIGY